MSKIISVELYRLTHSKKNWLSLIFITACFVAMYYIDKGASGSRELLGVGSTLPFFTAAIVTKLAVSDYGAGTMKNIVSCGISRTQVYIGKLLSAMIVVILLFAFEAVVTVAASSFFGGFGSDIAMGTIVESLLIEIVVALNYTTVFFLIGTVLRTPVVSMILSYAFVLLGPMALGFVGNFIKVNDINQYTLSGIDISVQNLQMGASTFMHLGFVTVIIVVVSFIGVLVYKKQSIK